MLSKSQDNLFLSQTPTRVVIGVVDAGAINCVYKNNPFNFQTFIWSHIPELVIGRANRYWQKISMDYECNQYVRVFFETNLALGFSKDVSNEINYRAFKHGYTLYAFVLTPSPLRWRSVWAKTGHLVIELTLSRFLPAPVHVLKYAEL